MAFSISPLVSHTEPPFWVPAQRKFRPFYASLTKDKHGLSPRSAAAAHAALPRRNRRLRSRGAEARRAAGLGPLQQGRSRRGAQPGLPCCRPTSASCTVPWWRPRTSSARSFKAKSASSPRCRPCRTDSLYALTKARITPRCGLGPQVLLGSARRGSLRQPGSRPQVA